jgi:hypothetical protein
VTASRPNPPPTEPNAEAAHVTYVKLPATPEQKQTTRQQLLEVLADMLRSLR